MSRLDEAVNARLQQIRDLVASGATELVGKSQRYDRSQESYEGASTPRRFGSGMREMFPELAHLPNDRPGEMARAIDRGRGPLYDRLRKTVTIELAPHVPKERKRSAEPPTVPAHEKIRAPGGRNCRKCGIPHGKGAHRSHGAGAFERAHPLSFAFGSNPVSITEAKKTFAVLMHKAKSRQLTEGERYALVRARQLIRMNRRPPIGNPPPGVKRNPAAEMAPGASRSYRGFLISRLAIVPRRKKGERPHPQFWFSQGGHNYAWTVSEQAAMREIDGLIDGVLLPAPRETPRHSGPLFNPRPAKNPIELGYRSKKTGRGAALSLGLSRSQANPRRGSGGGLVRMGKLVELRYERDHGGKRGLYRHPFARRPAIFYDPSTDSILIR